MSKIPFYKANTEKLKRMFLISSLYSVAIIILLVSVRIFAGPTLFLNNTFAWIAFMALTFFPFGFYGFEDEFSGLAGLSVTIGAISGIFLGLAVNSLSAGVTAMIGMALLQYLFFIDDGETPH